MCNVFDHTLPRLHWLSYLFESEFSFSEGNVGDPLMYILIYIFTNMFFSIVRRWNIGSQQKNYNQINLTLEIYFLPLSSAFALTSRLHVLPSLRLPWRVHSSAVLEPFSLKASICTVSCLIAAQWLTLLIIPGQNTGIIFRRYRLRKDCSVCKKIAVMFHISQHTGQ